MAMDGCDTRGLEERDGRMAGIAGCQPTLDIMERPCLRGPGLAVIEQDTLPPPLGPTGVQMGTHTYTHACRPTVQKGK